MATTLMFDLAYRFRDTRLWKFLREDEVFAVRLSDGETGYCCISGDPEQVSCNLYVGNAGFASLTDLLMPEADFAALSQAETLDQMVSENYLQCAFEDMDYLTEEEEEELRRYARANHISTRRTGRFPHFTRYEPTRFAVPIRMQTDIRRICDALSACTALREMLSSGSKKALGFVSLCDPDTETLPLLSYNGTDWILSSVPVPDPIPEYPSPLFPNEIAAARIRKMPKLGTWDCGLTWVPPTYEADDSEEAPYFSAVLVTVVPEEGMAVRTPASGSKGPGELANYLAELILEKAMAPQTICCRNGRTLALLKDFCEKSGIFLTQSDGLEDLSYAIDRFLDSYADDEMYDEDEDEDEPFLLGPEDYLEDEEDAGGDEDDEYDVFDDLYDGWDYYDGENAEAEYEEYEDPDFIEQRDKIYKSLMQMSNRELKRFIPQDFIPELLFLAEEGDMPDELARRVRKLFGENS